jgi:hypothetical protein
MILLYALVHSSVHSDFPNETLQNVKEVLQKIFEVVTEALQ